MTPGARTVPWRTVNAVLAALLALALAALIAISVAGARVLPGTSPADRAAQRYEAVSGAARSAMDAFLSVDYKDMDSLQHRLLAMSTGKFKKQYRAAMVNIRAAAQSARVKATPTVREVGINRLTGSAATAVVAADLVRRNKSTKKVKATKSCPHAGATCLYFRFTVDLTKTADGWKISNVEPVS